METSPNEAIKNNVFGTLKTVQAADRYGVERFVRLGAIVAEERDDMTARELLAKEQAEYAEKQAKAQAKAEERAKKAEADKARREAKEKGE